MGGDADRPGRKRTNGGLSQDGGRAEWSDTEGGSETRPSNRSGEAVETNGSDESATSNGMAKYRWTCPVCDETGTGLAPPAQGRVYSINNLRSHVRTTGDEAHGPTNAYPPTIEADLDECVELLWD